MFTTTIMLMLIIIITHRREALPVEAQREGHVEGHRGRHSRVVAHQPQHLTPIHKITVLRHWTAGA
jgi:hypothetical protein